MKADRLKQLEEMAQDRHVVGSESGSWIDSQAELANRVVAVASQDKPDLECFLIPQPGRVIIRQDDTKQRSAILYTPKDKDPKPTTGTVIAVPDDGSLDSWLGQKILFAQFSGLALNFKSVNNWRVLQLEEILAKFKNKDDQHELDTNIV